MILWKLLEGQLGTSRRVASQGGVPTEETEKHT